MTYVTKKFVFFVIATTLSLISIVLITSRTSIAKPIITWMPDLLLPKIMAGESVVIPVTFTSSKTLTNVEIWIVPEISPYVQVIPDYFSSISEGEIVNISMEISVMPDMPLGFLNGTIQARSDNNPEKVIAKPLSVEIEVIPEQGSIFRNDELGVSFVVPSAFNVAERDIHLPLARGGGGIITKLRSSSVVQEVEGDAPAPGCTIEVGIEDNSTQLSMIEWLKIHTLPLPGDTDEEILIAERNAIHRVSIEELSGDPYSIVFIDNGNIVYVFQYLAHFDEAVMEHCRNSFWNILNSFSIE